MAICRNGRFEACGNPSLNGYKERMQELFYVSASRGREDIAILTSDVNRLGESLGVSMARPSAIELANEIAPSKQQSVDLTPKASIEVPPPQLEISLGHGFELSM
jgi:hypothetical protein